MQKEEKPAEQATPHPRVQGLDLPLRHNWNENFHPVLTFYL